MVILIAIPDFQKIFVGCSVFSWPMALRTLQLILHVETQLIYEACVAYATRPTVYWLAVVVGVSLRDMFHRPRGGSGDEEANGM